MENMLNDRFMDCGNEDGCTCSTCEDNEINGGTCSHCFTCISGSKADRSVSFCYVPMTPNDYTNPLKENLQDALDDEHMQSYIDSESGRKAYVMQKCNNNDDMLKQIVDDIKNRLSSAPIYDFSKPTDIDRWKGDVEKLLKKKIYDETGLDMDITINLNNEKETD